MRFFRRPTVESILPILVIIILLALVGGGIWLLIGNNSESAIFSLRQSLKNYFSRSVKSETEQNAEAENYEDAEYGFSFAKPSGYTIKTFAEEIGKIILVQAPALSPSSPNMGGETAGTGFQIYVAPLADPDLVITKEKIQTDIPDFEVTEENEIIIWDARGLSFISDNPAFGGQSFEAWFVNAGILYQISGYPEARELIEQVIKGWGFER